VQVLPELRSARSPAKAQPAWCSEGIVLTGKQLATHGLQPPAMNPETAILIHLEGE
jgi:hypothetical protein